MVVHIIISAPGKLGQEDCHKFKVSPGYRVKSKQSGWEWDSISIKNKTKQKKNSNKGELHGSVDKNIAVKENNLSSIPGPM